MNKIISYLFSAIAGILVMAGCSDRSDEPDVSNPPTPTDTRAVLVYMVADNNLNFNARADINEMKEVAAAQCQQTGGRWMIYYSGPDHAPRLFEFDENGSEKIIKSYSPDEKSVTIARMREVIADFRNEVKADSYGLVLWSHGTGWIDDRGSLDEPNSKSLINPQSYGYDGAQGTRMKVTSLARALDGQGFDYIYFDCCHMATVEVAYELRNAAKIMVACPTELGVEGMPYDTNIAPLLNGDATTAAQNTFAYYNQHYNVMVDATHYCIYGCAISVIDLTKMDKLAAATRDLLANGAMPDPDYQPVNYFRSGITDGIYDIAHYMNSFQVQEQLKSNWRDVFNEVMLYESHTPTVYYLNATNFSGLGCNIILTRADSNAYGYNTYGWWTDVVSEYFTE